MTTVARTIAVARPLDEVAAVTTDPDTIFPLIGSLGRFVPVDRGTDPDPEPRQQWDLHLCVGTIHIGGRVQIEEITPTVLSWQSIRGTRHRARIEVIGDDAASRITVTMDVEFAGLLTGWIASLLARDVLARNLDAALERVRHEIEYGRP